MTVRKALVAVNGTFYNLPVGDDLSDVSPAGTVTLDFGSAPGTNVVQTVVTGQSNIQSNSQIHAWLMASATATHNAYEHAVVPMRLTISDIVAGTGFTVIAVSEWRLTGTFTAQWFVVP